MLTIDKINELTQGIEYHLRQLEGFMRDLREIKTSLDELRNAKEVEYLWELKKLRTDMSLLRSELAKRGLPNAEKYEIEFAQMKELIEDQQWPIAVDPSVICTDDEKTKIRAISILDLVVGERLKNKKFLDYGCGTGHVVYQATQGGASSLGYDIDESKFKFESNLFTNDFEEVKRNAPFDIILLHDVLDHIQNINPIEALMQAKSVLAPEGRIYIRNHPWSAKHGGHLYEQINKSYLHLVMDEVELARAGGFSCQHNIKVINPIETYNHWIKEAGLKITSEIPTKSDVPQFFKEGSLIREKLLKLWGDESAMLANMEIEFVEYVVELSDNSNQKVF